MKINELRDTCMRWAQLTELQGVIGQKVFGLMVNDGSAQPSRINAASGGPHPINATGLTPIEAEEMENAYEHFVEVYNIISRLACSTRRRIDEMAAQCEAQCEAQREAQ